jgi:uncharacterized protein involved in exopolysaccharide biosynthesis
MSAGLGEVVSVRSPRDYTLDEAPFSIGTVIASLVKYWPWMVAVPLGFAAVAIIVSMSAPRAYTSTTSFMPQRDSPQRGGLGSIAAQLSLGVGNTDTESPAFYARLLRSHAVLSALAAVEYSVPIDGAERALPLPQLLDVKAETSQERIAATVNELRSAIGVQHDRETGIVQVRVTSPLAALSQQLAAGAIEEVNRFNLERRQSRARAEREFAQARLEVVQRDLREAEQETQMFLERNRAFSQSPQLQFEHARLLRTIDTRQLLVNSLEQAYEQARLDEVRNTALITVIDPPTMPLRADSRGTASKAVAAVAVGLLFTIILAAMYEYGQRVGAWVSIPAADAKGKERGS